MIPVTALALALKKANKIYIPFSLKSDFFFSFSFSFGTRTGRFKKDVEQYNPRSEIERGEVDHQCGGEERSQGPKVWSADTRVACTTARMSSVPCSSWFPGIDISVSWTHTSSYSSSMFRNRPQPPLSMHEQSVNARSPLLADDKIFQKKNTSAASLTILGSFFFSKLIFQREHPRRCRRPRQVAAAVSHWTLFTPGPNYLFPICAVICQHLTRERFLLRLSLINRYGLEPSWLVAREWKTTGKIKKRTATALMDATTDLASLVSLFFFFFFF